MRKKLLSKKGLGLPVILAITSFFIISVLVLITVLLYQTKAREADFKYHQEYTVAQRKINAATNSIIDNDDVTNDFLSDLSIFMDLEITQNSASTIMISSNLSNGSVVSSYLADATQSLSLVGEYYQYDGLENSFEVNPLLTPVLMLENYLDVFFSDNFPTVDFNIGFADIDEIFTYIQDLTNTSGSYIEVSSKVLTDSSNATVNGHWYINGDVNFSDNRNLTIPEGYILFIDGNLKLKKNAVLTGNIVVNGDVVFDTRKTYGTVEGTVYASGKFSTGDNMYLGTVNRPTFIFSEETIKFKKKALGYAYLLANQVEVNKKGTDINIIGGVYANTD